MNTEKYNPEEYNFLLSYLDRNLKSISNELNELYGNNWAFTNDSAIFILANEFNILNKIDYKFESAFQLSIILSKEYEGQNSIESPNYNIYYLEPEKIFKLEKYPNIFDTFILKKIYKESNYTDNSKVNY